MRITNEAAGWEVTKETAQPKGENVFGNRFYGYREVELRLPDGQPAKYFGVLVGACVHSVVLDDNLNTYLVKQSRPNAMEPGSGIVPVTWELPGGFAKDSQNLEASVREELEQEARGNGHSIRYLGSALTAPGMSDERDSIFLVEGFKSDKLAQGSGEATEQDMGIYVAPFSDIYQEVMSGKIPTSHQTISGLAMADYALGH